jgi:hypothetical protein
MGIGWVWPRVKICPERADPEEEQDPMGTTFWTLGVALILGLHHATPAQGLVVPGSLAEVEGSASTSIPFGLSGEARLQCIYDVDELSFTGPRMIQKLSLRADFSTRGGRDQYPVKQFLSLYLAMSTTDVRAWEASTTFADNHGSDFTRVIDDARISLPAQPPLPGGPRPFNIELPFDHPWFYGGTPIRDSGPAPSGLLFDMSITSQPSGPYRLDVPGTCSSLPTYFGELGAACVTSRNGRPLGIEATAMLSGGSVTYTVSEMPSEAFFAVALALTDQEDWFGTPVPVDLTGYLQGAPGCWIHVPWQTVTLGQADQGGVGKVRVEIPLGRNYVGASLYAQAIARDLAANPLLHVTSQGLRTTVCGPMGVVRIYNAGEAWAESGQRSIGVAPVIEVR